MKMKTKLEVTKWEDDSGFELNSCRTGSGLHRFSAACRQVFEKLENKIASELGWRFAAVRPELLRQAVNEAAALAASTAFPTLFLPALAEEKVLLASEWERKQRLIQERSWLRAA